MTTPYVAHLKEEWEYDAIALLIHRHFDTGRAELVSNWSDRPGHLQWSQITEADRNRTPGPEDPVAWLTINVDAARAIYEELANYFGHGVVDARTTRKDLEHERTRVDLLIGHLTQRGDGRNMVELARAIKGGSY